VLRSEIAATLGAERFRREIETAARLQHPNILTVHDSGESGGYLWFTMPYVRGETLRDRLRRVGPLPVEEALRIAGEAVQALQYAHAEGVVHRDIKPENCCPDHQDVCALTAGPSAQLDGCCGRQ
jgi:serine/threonine-protein kinase